MFEVILTLNSNILSPTKILPLGAPCSVLITLLSLSLSLSLSLLVQDIPDSDHRVQSGGRYYHSDHPVHPPLLVLSSVFLQKEGN